ncbi:MAG TPA: AAA family ATPase [Nocardioides sp.]
MLLTDGDGPPSPRRPPRRIAVAGVSGVGKTTLCREIAARTGLPHTELDALFHGPGWTRRPQFLDDVRALVAGEDWVTEWQYGAARPLVAARAELLVWIDLPTPLTLTRVVRRTVGRRMRREELWNGNREGPLWRIVVDDEHIVRWAWRTRSKYRDGLVADAVAAHPELVVVRLRSRAAVRRWLTDLRPPAAAQ